MTPREKHIYELNKTAIANEQKQSQHHTLYAPRSDVRQPVCSDLSSRLAEMMYPAAADFSARQKGGK